MRMWVRFRSNFYGDESYLTHTLPIKREVLYTSKILREEFPYLKTKIPTLWTNSYFVSTVGGAPLEAIKQYIENQKTSQRQKDKQG